MPKKTVEQEINDFLDLWGTDEMSKFFEDITPLCVLYNVDIGSEDWVEKEVGEEDALNVRIIRTVYLLSIIAENHAGKLCSLKMQFKDLYKRMEKYCDKADKNLVKPLYIESNEKKIQEYEKFNLGHLLI